MSLVKLLVVEHSATIYDVCLIHEVCEFGERDAYEIGVAAKFNSFQFPESTWHAVALSENCDVLMHAVFKGGCLAAPSA